MLTVSPDGKWVAAFFIYSARLWDWTTGVEAPAPALDRQKGITRSVLSQAGKFLAVSYADGAIRAWDTKAAQVLFTREAEAKESWFPLAFSPDGRRLVVCCAAGKQNVLQIWDTATGKDLVKLPAQAATVIQVAFSPDGKFFALVDGDGLARVIETESGLEQFPLVGHSGRVHGIAFSPDGRRLATAGADRTIKLWDAATGKEILTLRGHSMGVSSVLFSPDGHRLVSAGPDRTLRIWDATP